MLNSRSSDSSIGLIACFGERRADGVVAEEELRDSKVRAETLHGFLVVAETTGFDLVFTSEVFNLLILVVERLQS